MKSLLLLSFFQILYAQNRVGNGGDAILCPDKALTLDLYETSETLKNYSESDEYAYAAKVLADMRNHAPQLEAQYQKRLKTIQDEIEFKSDVKLTDIKDSNHLFKPEDKDCKVRQAAIRKEKVSSKGKRFIFDKQVWEKMNTQNRSALLTHEIIYEHFYKLGEEDSTLARELNRFLYEERFNKTTKKEFWFFIKSLKVPIYQ